MVLKISQEELLAKAQTYSGKISSWTTQIFSELQVYQDTIEKGIFSNDEAILKYMETTLERNAAYPLGLYMGDDSDTFSFGEPYYDSMTGDVCVSASVHINHPEAVRVLATDVYLDYVAQLVTEISSEGSTKAFLVKGSSNTIIAHHDTSMLAVSQTQSTFVGLYEKVEETSRRVEQMISLIGNVDTVADQMKINTENQKVIAKQISDATKESNYHTEIVTSNSNVVAKNASALKKESMALMEKMNKFKL